MSEPYRVCSDLKAVFSQGRPLLDVRAPIEYAQGAFATATNIPLLNDEDRHLIGIEYKQRGQNAAISLGETLVSGELKQQRLNQWLRFVKENPDGALYCFRGGLRSRITQQWIFEESGINYPRIEGGYKALRRYLIEQIEQLMQIVQPVILSGRTGAGKTALLVKLRNAIDLEGLANHRGSTFGRHIEAQPTQINFENNLSVALIKHVQAGRKRLVFEAEGPNIGSLHTPQAVFTKTAQSPCVLLQEPLQKRVESTLNEYVVQSSRQHLEIDPENGFEAYSQYLLQALARVQRRLGSQRYNVLRRVMADALSAQSQNGDVSKHQDWITAMLKDYYDPMYDYQIDKKLQSVVFKGNTQEIHQYLLENQ